ncbi:unnamed protein product [Meloidogyne enterolobii]|uniref:Uncharacterized protein n=1 Tax=Meloidogyne enterolobii TaxID=390850 RepID=A0ACB0Z6P9_MELEN
MVKPKIYDEYEAQKAVNAAIDDTSIEDDFVDQYFEAALEVLTGKVQERSAASNHNLDLKQLEALLKLARKKLGIIFTSFLVLEQFGQSPLHFDTF